MWYLIYVEISAIWKPSHQQENNAAKIKIVKSYYYNKGLPTVSVVKNLPAKAGDVGLILGSGRSPGEGNGNPLQYSCLENPMDGGAWWTAVHGVTKSRTRLNNWAQHSTIKIQFSVLHGNSHLDQSGPISLCRCHIQVYAFYMHWLIESLNNFWSRYLLCSSCR